jgi:hypothetical protein
VRFFKIQIFIDLFADIEIVIFNPALFKLGRSAAKRGIYEYSVTYH